MDYFRSIKLGIIRRPVKFILEIFLCYSSIWTIIESISFFFSDLKLHNVYCYTLLILISIAFAITRARQKKFIDLKIGHSNTNLKIIFGDIFERSGQIAIPVNEFFDSEIGLPVSPKSLHGLVINKFFGGHTTSFDQLITRELADVDCEYIDRPGGKKNKYKIGTTAFVETASHKFLLFAFCHTNISNFKAYSSVSNLMLALEGLFNKARTTLGGDTLLIPLVGSGLSGLGLPPNQLIQIISIAVMNETKKYEFAHQIELVIHPNNFDEIDLESLQNIWR